MLKGRIEELTVILQQIHTNWKRADAVRVLANKRNITEETLSMNEFQAHRQRAMGRI